MKNKMSSECKIITVCLICKTKIEEFDSQRAVCKKCEKIIEAPYPPVNYKNKSDKSRKWKKKDFKNNRKNWNDRRNNDNEFQQMRMYNSSPEYSMYR